MKNIIIYIFLIIGFTLFSCEDYEKGKIKVQNKKNLYLPMANTNLMVVSPYKVLTGKTGYIRAADYCLATLVKNKKGKKLTAVVLGVPGDKLRFRECRKLLDWGFKNINKINSRGEDGK